MPSPEIFRRWAAISAVAGALERRVYTLSMGEPFFPNLYVFLVGTPASGKTFALTKVRTFWKKLTDFKIAPTSMTAASLSDALDNAKRHIVQLNRTPSYLEYNSLLIASPELSVLLPGYDGEMMSRLTDLYDCGPYEETRRTRGTAISIPNTQLNILAATTPSYLGDLLPQAAWDQGFISRVIMIYSGERIRHVFFADRLQKLKLEEDLIADLRTISSLSGKFDWTPEAAALIQEWADSGGPPAPDHPRLQHYNGRRNAHLLKLSMIASASRSNSLKIEIEDVQVAQDWLAEAETFMPDIFKTMGGNSDAVALDETYHFVATLYAKEGKPVMEHRIVGFAQQRVPLHSVGKVIEQMERASMIEKAGEVGGRHTYKPVPRTLHGQ
jgi:hypothetical protein